MGDVRDVHRQAPSILDFLNMDSIIKVLRVIWINGDDEGLAAVLTAIGTRGRHRGGKCFRSGQNRLRKMSGQVEFSDDRLDVDAGLVRRPEHLDDLPFGIDVAGGPLPDFNHDLISLVGTKRRRRGRNINIVDEMFIVRYDVPEPV